MLLVSSCLQVKTANKVNQLSVPHKVPTTAHDMSQLATFKVPAIENEPNVRIEDWHSALRVAYHSRPAPRDSLSTGLPYRNTTRQARPSERL